MSDGQGQVDARVSAVPPVDPDLEAPGRSDFDAIAAELAAPPEGADDTVVLEVATRPGYAVRYVKVIDHEKLQGWEKSATRKGRVDELAVGLLILANQCEAVIRHGEPITEAGTGDDWTFGSPRLKELLGGAERATVAVRRFYANDALVLTTARRLLSEAGYDDTPQEAADPTRG